MVRNQLIYYPTVTRDPFRNRGRITDLITSGKLFERHFAAPLDAAKDRVMICGSPALLAGHEERCCSKSAASSRATTASQAEFVVEKAFAER
jgi:ferredoxin--NADP+ reductase